MIFVFITVGFHFINIQVFHISNNLLLIIWKLFLLKPIITIITFIFYLILLSNFWNQMMSYLLIDVAYVSITMKVNKITLFNLPIVVLITKYDLILIFITLVLILSLIIVIIVRIAWTVYILNARKIIFCLVIIFIIIA